MTKKVKLSDVARDLQIPTQELIGFYQERDEKGNTKKGVTGLTPEEINLALEYYSQKTQVDSLDAYFASKDKPKSKQEKKSGDKKPADKKPADKKNSDKKPAEKKAADKKPADKKPQPEKKAEEKKKGQGLRQQDALRFPDAFGSSPLFLQEMPQSERGASAWER